MKKIVLASMALVCFGAAQPCFADDSDAASEFSAFSALSLVAIPVVPTFVAGEQTVRAGRKLIRLVDASGKALCELTSDALDEVDKTLDESDAPRVNAGKKQIPIVVRKDYVEMSQPVEQHEKSDK
ncbi:MAG: hypothetical protein ACRD3W_31320 [Terriglobales bacterium]